MTQRYGLYLLITFGTISSCNTKLNSNDIFHISDDIRDITREILKRSNKLDKNIETIIKSVSPKPQVADVIRGTEEETFYLIDSKRVYLKIDGKYVEDILKE